MLWKSFIAAVVGCVCVANGGKAVVNDNGHVWYIWDRWFITVMTILSLLCNFFHKRTLVSMLCQWVRIIDSVMLSFAVCDAHVWENVYIYWSWVSSRELFWSIIQSYVHYYRLLWDLVCIGCFYLCILDYYFIVTWNDYTKYNVTLWDEILGLESSSRIRSCVNRTAIIILSSQFK